MQDLNSRLTPEAKSFESPKLRIITGLVQKVSGINLGQGTCQLPVPQTVVKHAYAAIEEGLNRYSLPRGLLSARSSIVKKLARDNRIQGVNPESEVILTCGATGAFEIICGALINSGDKVVFFEPSYPYHLNTAKRYHAEILTIKLRGENWDFDVLELEAALKQRPKFLMINTPSNPTGKVFTEAELKTIAALCEKYDTLVVTDEIYEYMVFDGRKHISPASLPELRQRTLTIGGYSKTFAITGWRIGFLVVPEAISEYFAALADAIYVCPPSPFQEAIARSVNELGSEFYAELALKYQAKRDFFTKSLRDCGFKIINPQGSYYLIADYSAIEANLIPLDFVKFMIEKVKVGAVPADDFVHNPTHERWVRFCLAVEDSVLEQAAKQLSQF
ncbi:pyridoxal phosphate-dependent aminotransferase [bacterium]|nr:pyridoxal phosphate-dependent aminotransferase [bacterium]